MIDVNGFQYVFSGAAATNTTINSGGFQIVSSGAAAIGTTISSGGEQSVEDTAISTTITTIGSGAQLIGIDGTATSTTISGGEQDDFGTAISTTINSGSGHQGLQIIENGGTAISTTIKWANRPSAARPSARRSTVAVFKALISAARPLARHGGFQDDFGTATSTTISGGQQRVEIGGTAIGTTINSAGQTLPASNLQNDFGTAISTTINSRGLQAVETGATAISTTISGGQQNVFSGTAISTTISGGTQLVEFNGTASSTIISSGGEQVVQTSGTAIGTIISSGGSEIVNAGGTANNTTIASGGRLEILTNGVVGGVVLSGGTADLNSGAKVSAPIALVGTGGTLEIGGSAAPLSAFMSGLVVSGLAAGDTVDLTNVAFVSGATASAANGFLDVTVGGTSYALGLGTPNTFPGVQFLVSGDGATGTDVTLSSPPVIVSKGNSPYKVSSGHTDTGDIVISGGSMFVLSGGTADSTTVSSGGFLTISHGGIG